MFRITVKNTSGRDIHLPGYSGGVISSKSEWEYSMGEVTKRLIVECPNPKCDFRMSVPHVEHIRELIGCVIGCSGCGKHLIGVSPGKLEVFDDTLHKAIKALPKGDDA